YSKPEDPNKLFQKLLEDLKELAEYDNSPSKDRPIFLNDNEEHSVQNEESLENSSNEVATSSSNQEQEIPQQDSDIRKLIREECCVEVSEEQKQSMEDTMLELVKICQEKEFLCIHDNVEDLIESALNSKLLSINSNSQRLDNKGEEVKNVVEQPAERGNRIEKSLQNFRVIRESSISLKNSSQISSIHAVAPILSIKEPEYSPSMGYENSNTTLETELDEIMNSGVEELVPILSENDVTLKDKRECDVPISENSPICDDHSDIFFDSKNDDDILVYDDFEDVEYVEASLSYPEIVSVEEENVVHIIRLISNIEYLNDNPTPDCELNSSVSIPIFEESDNFLSDNFSPEFKTFCDHTKETRSCNTTHADDSLPEYDSFCFEIEPDQARLINVLKTNIPNDSSNDPLLEEVDLFLASDNSIPLGIENVADNSEGDIRFLEELLIDDSILSHESSDSNFKDNLSVPRPPPEPLDADEDTIFDPVYDDFEDVEYVEALLSYPEIVSVEEENVVHQEENVVHQEEEEDDLEYISQIQDIVLCEKLLSITRLISNIESLNDNPTPDCELNSSVSIPIFEDTTHADDSLPEYDSFCFEIEPDQARFINVLKTNIPNDSSNDPLLEEVDLFLASDNSIPSGIENVADNSEGDIRFLEELLIDDSILSHESSDSNFEDNLSVPRPPSKPLDAEFDAGEEIPVVMNDKDEDVD
nr:hypothetical protein [Tanacetum cinerariifolium]